MGVDARIKIKLSSPIEDKQITELAWKLAGAFGKETFFFWGSIKQCIERNEDSPIDTLDVHVSGRYYGIGYERGSIETYLAIAEWLEYNIPACSVLYGGDSSDTLEFFGGKERQILKEHFFKNGHLPYVGYFFFGDKNKAIPLCNHCDKFMIDYGGGGDKTFYYCYGCKEKAVVSFSKGIFRYNTSNMENEEVFEVSRKLDAGEFAYTPVTAQR